MSSERAHTLGGQPGSTGPQQNRLALSRLCLSTGRRSRSDNPEAFIIPLEFTLMIPGQNHLTI